MRFRKLRIAWSVGCGVLCLLLVLLWVRSSQKRDTLLLTTGRYQYSINTEAGNTMLKLHCNKNDSGQTRNGWHFETSRGSKGTPLFLYFEHVGGPTYQYDSYRAIFPIWLLLVASVAAGVLPMRQRSHRLNFSLRTLLIAMTLVAVVLGAIVYAVR